MPPFLCTPGLDEVSSKLCTATTTRGGVAVGRDRVCCLTPLMYTFYPFPARTSTSRCLFCSLVRFCCRGSLELFPFGYPFGSVYYLPLPSDDPEALAAANQSSSAVTSEPSTTPLSGGSMVCPTIAHTTTTPKCDGHQIVGCSYQD